MENVFIIIMNLVIVQKPNGRSNSVSLKRDFFYTKYMIEKKV